MNNCKNVHACNAEGELGLKYINKIHRAPSDSLAVGNQGSPRYCFQCLMNTLHIFITSSILMLERLLSASNVNFLMNWCHSVLVTPIGLCPGLNLRQRKLEV